MTKKFKILVVDDDLKNIQVGVNFLKQNDNYHLLFATSGEQALERVKETNFDLILLDIMMPTMDGYEVCRRLKADDTTKQIPVIFLTAKHEEDSLMKGFEVGGADYITKPFHAPELNARVRTHLELHRHYHKEIAKLHEVLACSQKAETIKFIASAIAHDCNNFMVSIPGNLFLLERKIQESGASVDGLNELFQGIHTATTNVTKLLGKFSLFSGRDKTVCESVDMNEVISDLNKVYKDYIRYNIQFDVEFFNKPAVVFADKLHVEQVLLNILINAQRAILERPKKMTEQGWIRLTIDKVDGTNHESLVDSKSYIRISIKDNGIGIASESKEKIFEPYFTTRTESGGSGLGLAVSMNIVKSHNGIIEVQSESGSGTQFNVLLPESG